jgi:transketolase
MTDIEARAINTIRFLAVDAIQKANSGHPGLPMGAAPMAYVLWSEFLKHNPKNPQWPDRDRFVLSGGHGSMLLYSLLHLTGYDHMTMEQLQLFRQYGSLTPGHPESHLTPGVESTTGPLGQGISNSIGMAIAERFLADFFNREGYNLIDHRTWVLASDGDMMEGVASEAASLAGHLKLGKLNVLYDDNKISLAASTEVSFTEDVKKRFESYGWQVLEVKDGDSDIQGIRNALKAAKEQTERPTLIDIHTTIGFGSPNKSGTSSIHGAPLGPDEVKITKNNLGWPLEPEFYIPDDVASHYKKALEKGEHMESEWNSLFESYRGKYPDMTRQWDLMWAGDLPSGWENSLPSFSPSDGAIATRKVSGSVINAVAGVIPSLIGGSADLAPSTNTYMKEIAEQQSSNPGGRNIRFGVREHAMGAAVNGMAYHGGVVPFGGTFLTFSDYMRGSVRISALASLHTIWVYTHDSVWLGEDGPTHQSVEHIAALRAIPNLIVIRPADANETVEAWKFALSHREGPIALIFSRQGLPVIDRSTHAHAENLTKGAYVLSDPPAGAPDVLLIATGSEVSLALEAKELIEKRGMKTRVVSMPSWELFEMQPQSYRDEVIPPALKARVVIETGVRQGWHKYAGERGRFVTHDRFGASAPMKVLKEQFGFTPERVVQEAEKAVKGV